jgi:hypothetical protein
MQFQRRPREDVQGAVRGGEGYGPLLAPTAQSAAKHLERAHLSRQNPRRVQGGCANTMISTKWEI